MTTADVALATHLATYGFGTVGTSVFVNYKPPAPDSVVVVFGYAGSAPTRTHDTSGNSNPGIQVWIRDASANGARTRIESVYNFLDGSGNFTESSVYFMEINAVSSPIPMGRDANGRYEYSLNFQVAVRRA